MSRAEFGASSVFGNRRGGHRVLGSRHQTSGLVTPHIVIVCFIKSHNGPPYVPTHLRSTAHRIPRPHGPLGHSDVRRTTATGHPVDSTPAHAGGRPRTWDAHTRGRTGYPYTRGPNPWIRAPHTRTAYAVATPSCARRSGRSLCATYVCTCGTSLTQNGHSASHYVDLPLDCGGITCWHPPLRPPSAPSQAPATALQLPTAAVRPC
jgi:hypothetical protein